MIGLLRILGLLWLFIVAEIRNFGAVRKLVCFGIFNFLWAISEELVFHIRLINPWVVLWKVLIFVALLSVTIPSLVDCEDQESILRHSRGFKRTILMGRMDNVSKPG